MDTILKQMLSSYDTTTINDKKNSIKEVMQEVVLYGLSKAGFFEEAAFYGGTALRIFHGLDRFSEDLDFSLKTQNPDFDFNKFLPRLEKEVASFGVNFTVEKKEKSHASDIKSAFLKGNTNEHLLIFYNETIQTVATNEIIKVKLEVDINPPDYATFEEQYRLVPVPYKVTLYDKPSLFSGKLHAVICRGWKNRVKGRDLYDYVYYLSQNIPFNLNHLTARLAQTKNIHAEQKLNIEDVREMLKERFVSIDYNKAKEDVLPFIKNPTLIDSWSKEFFISITDRLQATVND